MTNQQKGSILVGLLIAWGGITAYQMWESSESNPNDLSSSLTQGRSTLPSVNDLSVEQSFPNTRQIVTFSPPRHIFAPIGLPTVVARPVIPLTPPVSLKNTHSSPTPPGPSSAELAAQRAREQLNQFRFLGYLTKGGESQAFLTNGQAIYIVKQGEMLEGLVQVNKIEAETIVLSTEISETGNHIQATIPLTPETRS